MIDAIYFGSGSTRCGDSCAFLRSPQRLLLAPPGCSFLASEESLRRVRKLTGCPPEQLVFHEVDLCDALALRKMLEASPAFYACIHFAGLKVGVTRDPLLRSLGVFPDNMRFLEGAG